MAFEPRRDLGLDDTFAEVADPFEDAVPREDLERCDAGSAGERMPGVGESTLERHVVEEGGDAVGDDDPAERHVAGVDSLGEGDEVGGDPERIDGEPFAETAEAHHDLVGDVDDAVLVAEFADAGQVAGRRHEYSVGADDRLDDDRRDRCGAFEHDDVLEVLEGALGLLLGRGRVEGRPVQVGAEEVRDGRVARLVRPAARVAGERDRGGGSTVVRPVHRQHLAATGDAAGHSHGVLVGVRSAVGEEDLVQVSRSHSCDEACELAAHVAGHRGLDGGEAPRLLLDGANEVGVLVAEVQVDELRAEVEVGVAFVVPEGGAFASRDGQWIDLGLSAPGVEDVVAVVGAHLLLGGCIPERMHVAEPVGVAGNRIRLRGLDGVCHRAAFQELPGKASSIFEWTGSGHREVTTLLRV